ncbi:phytanoyl-CoA dioxygenase family protein [Alphaproteobacteria bacterium]|nr:phytanoyl-CoA dioxygenase family protein [Alphaproteobacteria bacterium]
MPKSLSQEQINQFHRDGYLFPVPILTASEAGACRQRLEQLEQMGSGRFSGTHRTKFYLRYSWAYELATNPAMLDAVEDLIGPDILLYHNTTWLKHAGDEAYVTWHQDNIYIGIEPCQLLTFWIALTPSKEENGCMQVLPGTHHEGVQPLGTPDLSEKSMLPSGMQTAYDVSQTEPVSMPLEAGEASVHHAEIIHGSLPNIANQRRMGITFMYMPAHMQQRGDRRTTAMLVRGEDHYGNFDTEIPPKHDDDLEAIARQELSANMYRAKEAELGKQTAARFD